MRDRPRPMTWTFAVALTQTAPRDRSYEREVNRP